MQKNIKNYIGLLGCIIGIIGCFLPFISILGINYSYIKGEGFLLSGLLIITMILIIIKKEKFSIIPVIMSLILYLFRTLSIIKYIEYLKVGFYIVLIGINCLFIYELLLYINNNKK